MTGTNSWGSTGNVGSMSSAGDIGNVSSAGDILFENKYEYKLALLRKWNSLSFKRSARYSLWIILAATIICAMLALLIALDAVFTANESLLGLSLAYITAGFMLAFFPKLFLRKQYDAFLAQQEQPQTQLLRTLRFSDKIVVTNGNTTTNYSYRQIRFIDETDTYFCLWVNGRTILVVYKNAFETGDAESFRAFILDKCSESQPLLTKKQLNRIHLRQCLAIIILLVFVSFVFLLYSLVVAIHILDATALWRWQLL